MKDEHTYGKKMARYGRNTVIYKGTFVSNHSLESGITDIVSAHLTFGDTLCRNLGQAFARTWMGICPPCPLATYAPV